MTQTAFDENVFTWPSERPALIGGRCGECRAVMFPTPASCGRCGSVVVTPEELPRTGTLWTFTTQEFLPKDPYAGGETKETFRPYGVGMVQLGDVVRVEGRLTESDPQRLRIGMPVELVVVPFRTEPDGSQVMTYAFAPLASDSEGEQA